MVRNALDGNVHANTSSSSSSSIFLWSTFPWKNGYSQTEANFYFFSFWDTWIRSMEYLPFTYYQGFWEFFPICVMHQVYVLLRSVFGCYTILNLSAPSILWVLTCESLKCRTFWWVQSRILGWISLLPVEIYFIALLMGSSWIDTVITKSKQSWTTSP